MKKRYGNKKNSESENSEKEKQVARYKLKLFLCVVIILFIGALIYAGSGAKYSDMNFFACLGNLFKDASDTSRYMTFDCGIIGGLLGYPLVVLFGSTAALFTSFVVTAALILIVANISIKDMTAAASRTAVHIREAGEERARVRRERREENRDRSLSAAFSSFESAISVSIPFTADFAFLTFVFLSSSGMSIKLPEDFLFSPSSAMSISPLSASFLSRFSSLRSLRTLALSSCFTDMYGCP